MPVQFFLGWTSSAEKKNMKIDNKHKRYTETQNLKNYAMVCVCAEN